MTSTESSVDQAESLKSQGNEEFHRGDFEKAHSLYKEALDYCPKDEAILRSVLLNNCAAAQSRLCEDEEAPSEEVRNLMITYCSESIELNPSYLKPLQRRAKLYLDCGEDKLDDALADYKRILELNPSDKQASVRVAQLEKDIEIRNEKLKDEMLSKLKDLGNLVLKPFGLSTNNFALNPNESGGYSVNFKPS